MLSDPVAEAFGLIHRHPSGENFWHGMGKFLTIIHKIKSVPQTEIIILVIFQIRYLFLCQVWNVYSWELRLI